MRFLWCDSDRAINYSRILIHNLKWYKSLTPIRRGTILTVRIGKLKTASFRVSKTQTVFWTPGPSPVSKDMKWSCNCLLTCDPGFTTSRRLVLEPIQYVKADCINPKEVRWEPLCGVPKKMKPFKRLGPRPADRKDAFTTALSPVNHWVQCRWKGSNLFDDQTTKTVTDEDNRSILFLTKISAWSQSCSITSQWFPPLAYFVRYWARAPSRRHDQSMICIRHWSPMPYYDCRPWYDNWDFLSVGSRITRSPSWEIALP